MNTERVWYGSLVPGSWPKHLVFGSNLKPGVRVRGFLGLTLGISLF